MANLKIVKFKYTKINFFPTIFLSFFLLIGISSLFSESHPTVSDFGTTGLLDMPSARMQKDGTFWASISIQDVADTYSLSYQVLPFLEASFRYHMQDYRGNNWHYFDRSYGLKLRLIKEGAYLPQVAIGLRDAIGTGIYNSEYLVLSKQSGPIDLTVGMGWGRLSNRDISKNPLRSISDSFDTRTGTNTDTEFRGGQFRPGDWFSGKNVGAFAGLDIELIKNKLNFLLEYNSDKYTKETGFNTIDVKSPVSYGLSYKLTPGTQLAVSWQHGSEWALRLTSLMPTKYLPKKPTNTLAISTSLLNKESIPDDLDKDFYDLFTVDMYKQGVTVLKAKYTNTNKTHLHILYKNSQYIIENDALNKLITYAELHFPQQIKHITFTKNSGNLSIFSAHYNRVGFNRFKQNKDSFLNRVSYTDSKLIQKPNFITPRFYPRTILSFGLGTRFYLFDPHAPFRNQIFTDIKPSLLIAPGISIRASYRVDLNNNFNDIKRKSNSVLTHVRSDVAEYLKEGATGINRLYLNINHQLGPNLYLSSYSGLLESMFSGNGLMVLYKPFDWPIGFGGNLFHVTKRGYSLDFDHLDYSTTTGHLSLFWASPFYNYDLALHYGKYLAKDWGTTIELNRNFSNGWQIGLFATFTNVSANEFGEGSFDKGFTFQIPLGNFFKDTKATYNYTLKPLQRDGGAMLNGYQSSLWQRVRSSEKTRLLKTKERLYE